MNKEEVLARLTEIGTCEDDVQRRTMLTELSDEISNVFDTNATLTSQNEQYVADNESLRSANMKLFLKIGGNKEKPPIDNTGDDKPVVTKKFEDLFNEKGELK